MYTPSPQVTRAILATHALPNLPGLENRFVLLLYPPGAISPPHTHPVDGVNYIIQGAVISQWEGEEPQTYHQGEIFLDYAERKHVRVENASKTEELRIVVSYIIEKGVPNVTMLE